MTLFTIDTELCNMDALCATDCPAQIIDMTDAGPSPIEDSEQFCLQCGHCVAICPKGAFHLNTLSASDCMPIDKKVLLNEQQVEHFLRSRRSIRQYKDKPVPQDILHRVLKLATCAPTAKNSQPTRWLIMEKRVDVKTVAAHVIDWMKYVIENNPEVASQFRMSPLVNQWEKGKDPITRGAPVLIFVYSNKEYGSGAIDCHTALAYLELAMPVFGLGSCWAGYVNYAAGNWPPLVKMIEIPDTHAVQGVLMAGYPKIRYARAPRRTDARISYFSQ